MNLEKRVSNLEHRLPGRDGKEIIVQYQIYGTSPTEKEREIAIKKARELDPKGFYRFIMYIPEGSDHIPIPPKGHQLEFDHSLGIVILGKQIWKFVEKYEKKEYV